MRRVLVVAALFVGVFAVTDGVAAEGNDQCPSSTSADPDIGLACRCDSTDLDWLNVVVVDVGGVPDPDLIGGCQASAAVCAEWPGAPEQCPPTAENDPVYWASYLEGLAGDAEVLGASTTRAAGGPVTAAPSVTG